ncbi:3132_t:CDS:2 [Dentiscutata heterogama]|uniref:3132_t:CDS:1 n=1 Tax=Dentiscutata heterogama TaxID=1316150 RepID=A0ACA9LJ53_9GLOM|nr:3132_t:CDS:2 [Dentiscutata heterogama]
MCIILKIRAHAINNNNNRVWIENAAGFRIGGDGSNDYRDCIDGYELIDNINEKYWVHAKVEGSSRKSKFRGPYETDSCFRLGGSVFKFSLNERDLLFCQGI